MIFESTEIVTLFLVGLTFLIPRKYFLLPLILAGCFVPADQRIIIIGLDFTVLRFIMIAGIARILIFRENKPIRWNNFDLLLLTWAICGAFVYVILWMNTRAVINRSGFLFDSLGLYWVFRQKIRSWSDIRFVTRLFAICAIILLPLVLYERISGQNPFVIMGRVVTGIREGHYRCQAAFPHSIMLGVFWVTLIPLFAGFSKTETNKLLYRAGIVSCIIIIFAVSSSTPILVILEVTGLLFLYNFRYYLKDAIYGLSASLLALQIVMSKPVWHLVARIDVVGGSTGWHRYHLINEAVNQFGDWALFGVQSTAYWGWGLEDITNEYILQAVRGGLITLILFVILLIFAVRIIYKYSLYSTSKQHKWLSWCFCVAILAHCLSFLGVSYFGQIMVVWYMSLAIAGLFAEYLYSRGNKNPDNS
jgi:hypothetical protein